MNSSFTSPTYRHRTASEQPSGGQERFFIREAQAKDLATLAEILTDSFHPPEGLKGLMHPLLRLGIHEDLRTRLRSSSPHSICLVALDVPFSRIPQQPDRFPEDPAQIDAATEGCAIVGTVEMTLRCIKTPASPAWQLTQSQHPYLSNLAVSAPYRRRQGASQLLYACEQIALQWGFPDIYLHVLENNRPARRLYYKTGYRVCSIESTCTAWLFGQPRRMLLHKRLNPDLIR